MILKESRGNTPYITHSTHFKTLTELNTDYNTQAQIIELTEDQLEAVEGGGIGKVLFKYVAPIVIDRLLSGR